MALASAVLALVQLTGPALAVHGQGAAPSDRVLTHSVVVDAPPARAWSAFTTAEGLEAWGGMRVLALDFRVGGRIETSYDPEARPGDPGNIVHSILSFEPGRMYSGTFAMPPQFPRAREEGGHWSVTRFEPVDDGRTRITLSMYGWGEGDDWDAAYDFFEWGNAYSLERLRAHFAATADDQEEGGQGADPPRAGDHGAGPRGAAETGGVGGRHAPVEDDGLAVYGATLGAAEANLRAGDTAAAWRWLDAVPEPRRGWEWRHLAARADVSTYEHRKHEGAITGLAFHPDSDRYVLASADGTASIWGAGTITTLGGRVLRGHEGAVYRAAFAPDKHEHSRSPRVATAGQDGTVRLWNSVSGDPVTVLWEHDVPVTAVAYSPDGALLAASTYLLHRDRSPPVEGIVKLFDVETGDAVATLRNGGHTPISQVTFTPDGRRVVISTWYSRVYVWDLHRPDEPRALPMSTVDDHMHLNDVVVSPDGRRIAASEDEGHVFVWDLESGETVWSHREHGAQVKAVAYTPDGARLVTGCHDRIIRVWDAGTGALLDELPGHRGAVGALAFDGSGRLWSADAHGVVRTWDIDTDRSWWAGTAVAEGFSLAFSPEGLGDPRVCLGTFEGASYGEGTQHLRVLDLARGDLRWTSPDLGSPANALAWRPGTEMVAVGLDDTRVELWDLATGERVASLQGPERQVTCVDFDVAGRLLAAGAYGGGVRVWDVDDSSLVAEVSHGSAVEDVDLSADGARLLSAGTDGAVIQWSLPDGIELMRLAGQTGWATAAAFSPDGLQVLTGDQHGSVRRFDAATGALLGQLAGHAGTVGAVGFSPDGRRILAASRVIRLHDAATGRELLTLRPPGRYRAWECEFSSDGETLGWTEWGGPVSLFRAETLARWLQGR